MYKFSRPKYQKYTEITTPNGKGMIQIVTFEQGINWYGVKLNSNRVTKFYAEDELSYEK